MAILPFGKIIKIQSYNQLAVSAVTITADGRRVVSASEDKTLKVWDLETGREERTLQGHQNSVYAVAITPDGRWVASGSYDKTLKVWNLETGALICTFNCEGIVPCAAVAPDGRTFVAGDAAGRVCFLRLDKG